MSTAAPEAGPALLEQMGGLVPAQETRGLCLATRKNEQASQVLTFFTSGHSVCVSISSRCIALCVLRSPVDN